MPRNVAPEWLATMARRVVEDENWPNGQYPHVAFAAREIVAEEVADDDVQVSLLQLVIDEVDRLRKELVDLADIAEAHHGDQPLHVLLHSLTVDIPHRARRAAEGEKDGEV